ncbi:MAG TPA: hypothetical protein DET40_07035 [Lentisphaeria bacterium]|nr:MAG: hypothetical protein A2X45_07265 [Lentisphaerae bacterium GWF2_50_93]HCE43285.1 hypothetical protein [Lentisphaeria bacterium]
MDKLEEFKEILKAFEKTFKCQITLHAYTADLDPVVNMIQYLHNNPYCSYIKEKAKQTNKCRYFDDVLMQQTLASKGYLPFFKYCHGRALELVIPLKAKGHLAGILYIGPFGRSGKDKSFPKGTVVSETFCNGASKAQKINPLPELLLEDSDRLMKISQLLTFKMESIANQEYRVTKQGVSKKELIEKYLNNSFKGNFSLGKLAEHLCLSESRVTQILREEFKQSLPDMLNRKKIDYASALLVKTFFSASQISSLSGFSTPAYFFRVFKKLKGMTAVEYRKKNFSA